MFSSRKRRMLVSTALVLAASTSLAVAESPGYYGYGKPATPAEIAGWDIDVRGDDGAGLPPGKGSVVQGSEVYADQCELCHGTFGDGVWRLAQHVRCIS